MPHKDSAFSHKEHAQCVFILSVLSASLRPNNPSPPRIRKISKAQDIYIKLENNNKPIN